MKIRFADGPQFVVEAENDQDRQILKMFVDYGYKNNQIFHLHGSCYSLDLGGITSFNFGYVKPFKKKSWFKRLIDKIRK